MKQKQHLGVSTHPRVCGFASKNIYKKSCGKKMRKWLGEVHKKPLFKLTQFEYDLIHTYSDCDENCKFDDCEQLKRLKDKGYFKQIDDDELIENILMSCEVSE